MGKLLAAALVALVTGCNYGAASFHCTSDTQCGAGGRCEQSYGGLCSFSVDPAICPSGYRFGDLAGPQSNQCVGAQPVDAGVDTPVDATIDAAIDAAIDAPPDAQACFGGSFLTICLQSTPSGTFTVSAPGQTINTDTFSCASTVSITNGGNYCVIAATTIAIDAPLRATGSRPLVLLASDSITTVGRIDVGSHRGQTPETGAGSDADTDTCMGATPPGTPGGGGAGGSFMGLGGPGGPGGNGGAGGQPAPKATSVTKLRGGCPGQDGQSPMTADKGLRGHGGGVVYLIAGTSIDIRGGINAAGEGGAGGIGNVAGAGGGGAGGMIGFDAPLITCNSLLVATGGGGGEGSDNGPNTPGANGSEANGTGAPSGGGGQGRGGDGGAGSVAPGTQGGTGGGGDNSGPNRGGGGAGGGGTGLIKGPASSLGGQVAPPATP